MHECLNNLLFTFCKQPSKTVFFLKIQLVTFKEIFKDTVKPPVSGHLGDPVLVSDIYIYIYIYHSSRMKQAVVATVLR